MLTFDEFLASIPVPDLDPLVWIIGALIALVAVLLLFRFAAGLAFRILSIGCVIIVILAAIWFVLQVFILN